MWLVWKMAFSAKVLACSVCTDTPGACIPRVLENLQPNALRHDFLWAVLRLFASEVAVT